MLEINLPHADAQSDIESVNSSQKMDIIRETPNRPNIHIDIDDFETKSWNSHNDTSNNNAEIA